MRKFSNHLKTLSLSFVLNFTPLNSLLAFSAAGEAGGNDHFSQATCLGCHSSNTVFENFTTIESGPANMLLPNTVYQVRISASSVGMTAGRDAYKVQVLNVSTGGHIGVFLDGPNGNIIPDTLSNSRRKEGSRIADTTNGTETFRDYYWRSPAGPNELPALVTITGFFLDGSGDGEGGEPQGKPQVFELKNPNFKTDNKNGQVEEDALGGEASSGTSKSGFSDISTSCGRIREKSADRLSDFGLLLFTAFFLIMIFSMKRRA